MFDNNTLRLFSLVLHHLLRKFVVVVGGGGDVLDFQKHKMLPLTSSLT